MKLWDKGAPADAWVHAFTTGDDARWDTMLLPYDAAGTAAHAWALNRIGLLSDDELASIETVLEEIAGEARAGRLVVTEDDEDAHTVIEGVLTTRLGDAGRRIHAGRSRNDQVLVALRLWMRDALARTSAAVAGVAGRLIDIAERDRDVVMPGYTHTQRAMPTTAGLWAAGYAELMVQDLHLLNAARSAANLSPWGSAAGYGVPYLDLPRDEVAERLGFEGVQRHVTAVQLSRGKLEAAVAHALAQCTATAGRLAADLVLFATAEFGFLQLAAEVTTGSSIMPQKRNPDVAELIRATHHRVMAELQLLLSLPAGLPGGYHRDLQLTKESVMRATLSATAALEALDRLLPGMSWNHDRMAAALTPDTFATAEALRRVNDGVPFREAYRQAAGALGDLRTPDADTWLESYRTPGSPGRVDVEGLRESLRLAMGERPADG